MIQIITVTLNGQSIDCKVRGSPLSVAQYADAIALVIRSVAGLFAASANVTEAAVVEEILKLVDHRGRIPVDTEFQHLH